MSMLAAGVARLVRTEPLDPDADEARRWLQDELSEPPYRAAEPNAFDRAMQAVRDWFLGLLDGAGAVPGEVVAHLVVRELVQVHPGSTARALADEAARPFPAFAPRLADAAADFDAVRYLDRPGDVGVYDRVTRLDRDLQAARPALVGAAGADAPLDPRAPESER